MASPMEAEATAPPTGEAKSSKGRVDYAKIEADLAALAELAKQARAGVGPRAGGS